MRDRIKRKFRKQGISGVLYATVRRIVRFVLCVDPITRICRKIKIKLLRLFLRKRYDYVIQKYKNYVPQRTENYLLDNTGVVWSMWWQGEENAPETVKLCLASIRKHCGVHKFVIITKDNLHEYLDLPEHITSKVEAGYISFTHLSDIIRVNLLAKYGGLWLDSAMFLANDLPDEVFATEYYTCKYIQSKYNVRVPKCKWVIGIFGARRKSCLFCFIAEMFSEYLKTHNKFLDFYLTDQILVTAFYNIPEVYNEWEKIPYNNPEWFSLYEECKDGKEWNPEFFAELASSTTIHRLTYKSEYDKRTKDGKETFYAHLLAEYGITE